jgi:hypothetical protein
MRGTSHSEKEKTMKLQSLAALLLLAASSTALGQTPKPASKAKSMNYKLVNMQNNKTTPKPTDDDVKTTVASLGDDFGPVIALETESGDQPLSMDEIDKGKFGFTCQDGDVVYTTKKRHECAADVAVKIIISYRDSTADWKKLGDWDQIPIKRR